MKKISIAIAGHTNTGKTTLLRCLTKISTGKVEDRANVTVENQTQSHEAIQAHFIDTPGLQKAETVLILNDLFKNEAELENKLNEKGLKVELEVIKALKEIDVVYYVTHVSVVPDDSYESEIYLIRNYCDNVIGVINKSNELSSDQQKLQNRINQWSNFFKSRHIDFIEYDFHWDSPQKQVNLYNLTKRFLNKDKQELFSKGILDLELGNKSRRKNISEAIKSTLKECNNLSREIVVDHESETKLNEEAKNKLTKDVVNIVSQFSNRIGDIYSVKINDYFSQRVSLSTKSVEDILMSQMTKKVESTVENATAGAGLGAFFGVFSGAATLAQASAAGIALTGGLFLAPLAIIASIGLIGGAIYGATRSQNDTKKVVYSLQESDLFEISKVLTSVVWTIAYYGFEINNITSNKSERIESLVDNEIPKLHQKHSINVSNYKDKIVDMLNDLGV